MTFEYILIKGKTCSEKNADELKGLLRGWLCKINLIACNPVKEFPFEPPARGAIEDFLRMLEARGVHGNEGGPVKKKKSRSQPKKKEEAAPPPAPPADIALLTEIRDLLKK